ncbi:hypothetical protein M6B38_204330 [Iris pallida]|uniref:Uncharacterized protein n=1 Tax=Iris pallida TaxID=29817 RepID=A0AAX6E7K1_IRIPA|nr:hypothetical protein M6B38_204325 [Iris pallida]KAJ6799940.1 hypothetical protein M6B38_204330 [Iris pallida]
MAQIPAAALRWSEQWRIRRRLPGGNAVAQSATSRSGGRRDSVAQIRRRRFSDRWLELRGGRCNLRRGGPIRGGAEIQRRWHNSLGVGTGVSRCNSPIEATRKPRELCSRRTLGARASCSIGEWRHDRLGRWSSGERLQERERNYRKRESESDVY